MNFVPSSVKAEEWGITQRRVAIFCKEGRDDPRRNKKLQDWVLIIGQAKEYFFKEY